MSTKRVLIAYVAVLVVAFAYEYAVYGVLMESLRAEHAALLNPTQPTLRMLLTTAFTCAFFTVFYALFARGAAARLSTGVVFGIFMGILGGWIPHVYLKMVLVQYPFYLHWAAAGFFEALVLGIVLGIVYRNN